MQRWADNLHANADNGLAAKSLEDESKPRLDPGAVRCGAVRCGSLVLK